jgi:hypothetical protein
MTDRNSPLAPDQVNDALAALPGWTRRKATLVRQVPVAADSRAALREAVDNVVSDRGLRLEDSEQGLTITLGAGTDELTGADLEAAARIDSVLSGSATDHGTV